MVDFAPICHAVISGWRNFSVTVENSHHFHVTLSISSQGLLNLHEKRIPSWGLTSFAKSRYDCVASRKTLFFFSLLFMTVSKWKPAGLTVQGRVNKAGVVTIQSRRCCSKYRKIRCPQVTKHWWSPRAQELMESVAVTEHYVCSYHDHGDIGNLLRLLTASVRAFVGYLGCLK